MTLLFVLLLVLIGATILGCGAQHSKTKVNELTFSMDESWTEPKVDNGNDW